MSEKKYYDPAVLPLCDSATLGGLCDQGKITDAELVAAKFRQQAPWMGDKTSARFRAMQKWIKENPRPEQA